MRLVKSCLLLMVLLGLAACSYVDGNYPPPKIQPPALPESYSINNEPAAVVWEILPSVRGFYGGWWDMDGFETRLKAGADAGNAQATQELEFIQGLQAKNLAAITIAVFLEKGTTQRLSQGQLQIDFVDGTGTRDEGVIFYEMHQSGPRRRTTLVGTQTLDPKMAETGKPLMIRVLVPLDYKGQTVERVRMV